MVIKEGRKVMLSSRMAKSIVEAGLTLLGKPYEETFHCIDFVKCTYGIVGLPLPPVDLNLTADDLNKPPVGYVLYLRHKRYHGTNRFTHAGIILENKKCIHCSYYFGMAVVITDLDNLFEIYDIAR